MNKDLFEEADKRFDPVGHSKTFNNILCFFDLKNKKVLDLGCGFGEHLVHFGPGSIGVTTNPEEVEYGKARNIKITKGNIELVDELGIGEKFDVVWANNVFEHILSPHAFLIRLKKLVTDDSILILGVPVVPSVPALMKLTRFRGALSVAHTNFFTKETLKLTALWAGWKVKETRSFYFANRLLDKAINPISPHLYMVLKNDKNFSYHDKKLKEWKADPYYEKLINYVRD